MEKRSSTETCMLYTYLNMRPDRTIRYMCHLSSPELSMVYAKDNTCIFANKFSLNVAGGPDAINCIHQHLVHQTWHYLVVSNHGWIEYTIFMWKTKNSSISKILFPTSRLCVHPFVRSSVRRLAPIPAGESQDVTNKSCSICLRGWPLGSRALPNLECTRTAGTF